MQVEETTRQCRKCLDTQPIENFRQRKERNNNRIFMCNTCWFERARKRDQRRYSEQRKSDPRHRASILLNSSKKRAQKRGLDHSLDLEWIYKRLKAGVCEVTGIPFKFDYCYQNDGQGQQRSFSPSLDRIDPEKGYTKENTQLVVWVYNAAKGVDDHASVLVLAEALCKKTL
jgi:hypothetical protein